MKQNIRSYISMLMLALLLFPMAEKAVHELGHLNDEHCAIEKTHFCTKEHSCAICHYIFSSSSAILPDGVFQLDQPIQFTESNFFAIVTPVVSCQEYTSPLRGPPCV